MTTQTLSQPLSVARVRELSQMSTARALVATALTWGLILLTIWGAERVNHPVVYVIAVMFIANQQHSLLIQMHDAAHKRLSKNRIVNELVGELFCAWPMFFRMAAYRDNHKIHHKHANTALDPDFRPGRFPKTQKEILKMLLRDVTALNTVEQLGELKRLKKPTTKKVLVLRVLFFGATIAAVTALGLWKIYLLYWIVPLFTWLKVVLRMRAIADHAGVHDQPHPFDTRTVIPNLFDRIFLAPRNCSYHLGHHLYSTVPWYNLKKLHVDLMANQEFAKRCRITRGFWRLFLEFPWDEKQVKSLTAAAGKAA